jgi:NAD+ synthase
MNPGELISMIEFDNPSAKAAHLAHSLQAWGRQQGFRGAVVGVSGGVDSAVTLALAARAFGSRYVLGLALPDRDSEPLSAVLASELAASLDVELKIIDITSCLDAWGAYVTRDEAARSVFSAYDPTHDGIRTEYRFALDDPDAIPLFCLTRVASDGSTDTAWLRPDPYRRIVAATNLKQRSRMTALYFEAEYRGWAVIGTSNLLEISQGFFVKHGDGGGDVFPLGSLYKTQVYQLARALNVPPSIIERPPTTDTYSAAQTQQQFFYGLPVRETDLLWAAFEHGVQPEVAAEAASISAGAARKVMASFERRRRQASFLRHNPLVDINWPNDTAEVAR